MARRALWLWWGGVPATRGLCLPLAWQALWSQDWQPRRLEEWDPSLSVDRTSRGRGRETALLTVGSCFHLGMSEARKEPLLCRTLFYCVWGHESYLPLPCSPSRASTHARSEAHSLTHSRAGTYTNASRASCHILPLAHLCLHVDTAMILYALPHIHTNTPPRILKLTVTFVSIHADAHGNTHTNQCTFKTLDGRSHPPVYTYVHLCPHTSTYMFTCT